MKALRSLLLIIPIFFLTGCGQPDPRLSMIEKLADTSPEQALDSLEATDYELLSSTDRHYYDFLSVKIPDKAYVMHLSDSLILGVIDFESDHRTTGRYPEALYYGGRVYSDMGDYPTALKYFQEALSATGPESDINLRGRILSQTARLLNKLRLYDEALTILDEAVHIDSIENNVFNLVYDHQLIGSIYLGLQNHKAAGTYFHKAAELASELSPEHRSNITVYLAACELEKGNIASARALIRTAIDSVSPMYRNLGLAYASDIYLKSNILDSAYIYAYRLAHSEDPLNRRFGYANLLSPELLPLSSKDSIFRYITDYKTLLNEDYNSHGAKQALMQQSLYNYQIHERERMKAEKARGRSIIWLFFSSVLVMTIIIIFLLYRIRTKHTIIRLHETIARLNTIQHMIDSSSPIHIEEPSPITEETSTVGTGETVQIAEERSFAGTEEAPRITKDDAMSSDPESLREQLKQKISFIDANLPDIPLPHIIATSDAYRTLKIYADNKKYISDSDPVWDELYALILQVSPDFETKLAMLTGGNIKRHELQTIILIKCGMSPTQMTYLLGKTKGSISSRREAIGIKMLGIKTSVKIIDAIIRSL